MLLFTVVSVSKCYLNVKLSFLYHRNEIPNSLNNSWLLLRRQATTCSNTIECLNLGKFNLLIGGFCVAVKWNKIDHACKKSFLRAM